mmetsp:Transcript_60382/g.160860  ORF Transcript_60382/g.160860 Transcript_60382/m.160860 type:complete len:187 (+) Transcript_60382:873-1433(+)
MFLHHHLNGGKGDTFYQFDLDRTSLNDLFLFLFRIFDHMIGTGSLRAFKILGQDGSRIFAENHDILWRGMFWYWVTVPTFIISVLVFAGNCGVGQIAWFMWFVYLQPLFGMTFFLAFMNFALHGFVEFGPEVMAAFRGDRLALCLLDGCADCRLFVGGDGRRLLLTGCDVFSGCHRTSTSPASTVL